MSADRYVRFTKGEMVCQRQDLQGVIAHLHDLARHLEHLIPDEDFMEKLTRSRDFTGGFATLAEYQRQLERDILEALSLRREGHAYEPLCIEGYSNEQIESAVYRLWRDGMIDAHSMKPKQVTPSTLTTKGFRKLQKLSTELTTKGGA